MSNGTQSNPRGIAGLRPVDPVGVVASCGVKSEKGFPIERDRWHLVEPRERDGKRHLHERFAEFNARPVEKRKVLHGMITHAGEKDCFWWNRTAHQLRAPYYRALGVNVPQGQKTAGHPNRKPCCVGDGKEAKRWMGGDRDNFKQIKCPNDKCEFASKIEGEQQPPCKPSMEFLFLLCWPFEKELPSMLCRIDSHSWRTTQNFVGFFNHITDTAAKLGLDNYSLFGYPFEIRLGEETQPSEKRKFPVSYITPTMEPMEFFSMQRSRHRLLSESVANPILIEAEIEEEPSVIVEVGAQVLPAASAQTKIAATEEKPAGDTGIDQLGAEKIKLREWYDKAVAAKKKEQFAALIRSVCKKKINELATIDDYKRANRAAFEMEKEWK